MAYSYSFRKSSEDLSKSVVGTAKPDPEQRRDVRANIRKRYNFGLVIRENIIPEY